MHTLAKTFLALLLLAASKSAFAITVNQKNICNDAPVPSGWVVANKAWSRSSCGNPLTPQGNVWLIEEYDNLPVGAPLTMCAFSSPVPAGWIPTSTQWNPSLCGAQFGTQSSPYNTITMRYVACTNETSKLCYPSLAQFAVISALPKTVPIPYGQGTGSTVIGWFAPIPVCVWVSTGDAAAQLWSCAGNYAVQTWPYASPGVSQTFMVSPSSTSTSPLLASVVVKGVEGSAPRIFASPTNVTIPAGKLVGSTTVSYNLSGSDYPAMCIWVSTNATTPQLWACGAGTKFSQVWPYVPKGGKSIFWLNPSLTSSSQILASIVVTGH
jgi:hypothetical protein